MIGSSLLRYQTKQKYLIWDTETEGLNLFFHRPWQIAWSTGTAKSLDGVVVRHIRWPDIQVTKGAAALTGFNLDHYLQIAEPADEVLADFEKLLLSLEYRSVGHNLLFDAYMHKVWRHNLGMKPDFTWMERLIDTHLLSKAFKKNWTPDLENFSGWQWKATNFIQKDLKTRLGLMCQELGIEFDANMAHRANYDIQKTHELFGQLIWKVEV